MLVLLGGWAFLGDKVSLKQLCGMALAVLGMVFYGIASSQCAPIPHLSISIPPSQKHYNWILCRPAL